MVDRVCRHRRRSRDIRRNKCMWSVESLRCDAFPQRRGPPERPAAMSTEMSAPPVTRVSLVAPITGVLVPIEQVPDPVFAQKMVGEGVSIDPLSNTPGRPVRRRGHPHPPGGARPDDPVRRGPGGAHPHRAGHRAHEGRGLHRQGEGRATRSTPVTSSSRFDLDAVATNAKSLLTQMVIANSDLLSDFAPALRRRHRGPRRGRGGHPGRRRRGRRRRGQAGRPEGDVGRDPRAQPGRPARPSGGRAVEPRRAVRERHHAQARRGPGERQERDGDHGHGGQVRRQGAGRRLRDGRRARRSPSSPRRSRPASARKASSPIAEAGVEPAAPVPAQPRSPRPRAAARRTPTCSSASRPRRGLGVGTVRAGPARGLRGHRGLQRPAPGTPPAQRRHRPGHGPARGAARTG